MSKEIKKQEDELTIPEDKLEYLQKELTNIREEVTDDPYIQEAIKVLAAGGLRSTIGSYWNAVVHDIRIKVEHRSLDLFNKEMSHLKDVKEYEDFQNHITDHDLIEGAYKIGVLSWEGRKLIQQARETRNIFDGHPKSSNPTLFKVFNMIADCNKYVLSQPLPIPSVDIDSYITNMDSTNYNQNEIAVEQTFSDLPEIYKHEISNKLFTIYTQPNASTNLRGNIEFAFPILWRILPKELRQTIGKRFDTFISKSETDKIGLATQLLTFVDGFRYASETSRRIIYEPLVKQLEENLDNWAEEGDAMTKIESLGSVIPTTELEKLVKAMTLTYVGYKGSSMSFARTDFYSNRAEPKIVKMFERFDNNSIESFIKAIRSTQKLKNRIQYKGQLDRLRVLADVLLNKQNLKDEHKEFLELLVKEERTEEFMNEIRKNPT